MSKFVARAKKVSVHRRARPKPSVTDDEVAVPTFESEAEMEAWWDALPRVEIEFDERLKKQINISLRLNQKTVEQLDRLAQEKGIRRESLIQLIIDEYLSNHLPPEF